MVFSVLAMPQLINLLFTHFLSTISEAPLVNSRKPPLSSGMTVDMDFLTELNV